MSLLKKTKQVQLKNNLIENEDYLLLSDPVWGFLYSRYRGGPIIKRFVIAEGTPESPVLRVEVYLLHIKVSLCDNSGNPLSNSAKSLFVSKKTTVKDFKTLAVETVQYIGREIRIWIKNDTGYTLLNLDSQQSMDEEGITQGDTILVERRINNIWPRDEWANNTTKKKKSILSYFIKDETSSSTGHPGDPNVYVPKSPSKSPRDLTKVTPGLCGLVNLGNTCFMNTALQCLSNTQPLTDYFSSKKFKHDINKSNPLGMKGAIADAYGSLISLIWSGSYSSVAPKQIKQVIGKYAPRFEGYSQHDTHELFAFLLDGLHEDLNRVTQKPYLATPDSDTLVEFELAHLSWKNHLLRNQSIIVDLFQGQLKSTVQCPKCQKVSVTFDPFMYLSLPLREETQRMLEITYIKFKNEPPVKYAVLIPKNAFFKDLKAKVCSVIGIDNPVVFTDILNHRIHCFYKDSEPIRTISERDTTFCYEIEKEKLYLRVVQRRIKSYHNFSPIEVFSSPFVVFFDKDTTYKQLYLKLWDLAKKFLSNSNDHKKTSSSSTSESVEKHSIKQTKPNFDWTPVELDFKNLPFTFSIVSGGTYCKFPGCPKKNQDCNGCIIDPSDNKVLFTDKDNGSTIAVTWSENAIKTMWSKFSLTASVKIHPSVDELKARTSECSLMDCVDLFTKNEQLGPEDPWFCPKCKEHQQAFKKFDLWKLPNILVIQLKRFSAHRFREKLSMNVIFPTENLDLSQYVINEQEKKSTYSLYAISNHFGSMAGGHYTAYCRNENMKDWFIFDDSNVRSLKGSPISSSAYVLFYQKMT